jgi:hypothetical protein
MKEQRCYRGWMIGLIMFVSTTWAQTDLSSTPGLEGYPVLPVDNI